MKIVELFDEKKEMEQIKLKKEKTKKHRNKRA